MKKSQLKSLIKESILKEFHSSMSTLYKYIEALGYDDIDAFLSDNPGASGVIEEWIWTIPEFAEKLDSQGYKEY